MRPPISRVVRRFPVWCQGEEREMVEGGSTLRVLGDVKETSGCGEWRTTVSNWAALVKQAKRDHPFKVRKNL